MGTGRTPAPPHTLSWQGSLLELRTRRGTWRSEVTLVRDGEELTSGHGTEKVLLELPGEEGPGDDEAAGGDEEGSPRASRPVVHARFGWSGGIKRAHLLVPPPGGLPGGTKALVELPEAAARLAGAQRFEFAPPLGSRAARMLALGLRYPRLYAARHVLGATAKVLLGLLGVAVFVRQLLAPLVRWIRDHVPHLDLPSIPWPDWDLPDIPWPDVDLPSIPWPDWDLPDVSAPPWLLAVLATAKFWIPVLIAVGVAVNEVRRRRTAPPPGSSTPPGGSTPNPRPAPPRTDEDPAPDAHRGPREAPPAQGAHRGGGGGALRGEGGGGDVDR